MCLFYFLLVLFIFRCADVVLMYIICRLFCKTFSKVGWHCVIAKGGNLNIAKLQVLSPVKLCIVSKLFYLGAELQNKNYPVADNVFIDKNFL